MNSDTGVQVKEFVINHIRKSKASLYVVNQSPIYNIGKEKSGIVFEKI